MELTLIGKIRMGQSSRGKSIRPRRSDWLARTMSTTCGARVWEVGQGNHKAKTLGGSTSRPEILLISLALFAVGFGSSSGTPSPAVQRFVVERYDGLWPSSSYMNITYSAVTLVQSPSWTNCSGIAVSDFTFHPGNVSSCGGDAFPFGIVADDFPGWTDGVPGSWLFGFFADPDWAGHIASTGCDQRLIWTEGGDSRPVCEFRIRYGGKGNGTVDCDCNFTTGNSPPCTAFGMRCEMTFDQVQVDGRLEHVHQAVFFC